MLVQQCFVGGDCEQSAALIGLVERLLQEGDDSVKAAIATGFVKRLRHWQQFDPVCGSRC